jgi:hypothetical protein
MGRRIGADLRPIDASPLLVTANSFGPSIATNGTDFLVVTRFLNAHRANHADLSSSLRDRPSREAPESAPTLLLQTSGPGGGAPTSLSKNTLHVL